MSAKPSMESRPRTHPAQSAYHKTMAPRVSRPGEVPGAGCWDRSRSGMNARMQPLHNALREAGDPGTAATTREGWRQSQTCRECSLAKRPHLHRRPGPRGPDSGSWWRRRHQKGAAAALAASSAMAGAGSRTCRALSVLRPAEAELLGSWFLGRDTPELIPSPSRNPASLAARLKRQS